MSEDQAKPDPPSSVQQEPEFTDEQIFLYEQRIRGEAAERTELVCQAEPISKLYEEYAAGSQVFQRKIQNLAEHHDRIRRARGDGNCFFRAFAFAWFESLLLDPSRDAIPNAIRNVETHPALLVTAGFEALAYEDFYDIILAQLNNLPSMQGTPEAVDILLAGFQSSEVSNAIVMHLRFVTSAFLKTHTEEYEPFLESGCTMELFCANEVECMGRESDMIHIIALTRAFAQPVSVAYLDGSMAGGSDEVNFHEFIPEDANGAPLRGAPVLKLIYRPGHYDILYEKRG
jgi:ubiquitin thioesterase protein OTUB1